MRFDRLRIVNFVPGKTSPKAAPKPGSWAFAENFVDETEQSAQARDKAVQLGVAPIGRGSVSALTLLAKAVQARAVVEVGTGSGVSGLALFAGMQPDGVLTSVDIEAEHQQAARQAFLAVGIPTQRFRLIAGPALSVLPRLSDGGYDMVFIDADKSEYAEYVEEGLRLLRHGGLLAVDNALWHDRTADESNIDPETEAIRKALNAVRDNEDLVPSLLPVGDGLLVAVKR
jgi:predicted O-methyltransferase YrrM